MDLPLTKENPQQNAPDFPLAATAFLSDPKYQTCAFLCLAHLFQGLPSCEPGAQLVAQPLMATAGSSTSPAPDTSRAGPRTGPRGWGPAGRLRSRGSSVPWQAAASAQALVCDPPSQAGPAPPAPNLGTQHPAAEHARRPRCSTAEAEAGAAPLPGRRTTFQRLVCSSRSSPGSRVQSSRGAVREMQLRFLSTLLRMVPTPPPPLPLLLPPPPPPPPPPCRFRHLPPRLREPVSFSCRIRERPGSGAATVRLGTPCPTGVEASRGASKSPLSRGLLGNNDSAASARGSRGPASPLRSWNRGAPAASRHLHCGVARLRLERAWGGEKGGNERASAPETKAALLPPIPASPCEGGAALAPKCPSCSQHLSCSQRSSRFQHRDPGAAELQSPEPGAGR